MEVTEPSWHALPIEVAVATLTSDATSGISTAAAQARLAELGPNVLERQRGPDLLRLLGAQLHHPIIYLLLGSAALAVALGKLVDGLVVMIAVVVNVVIGFLQEYRAGRAIDALSKLVPQDTLVVRDGRTSSVPAAELVPGDLVVLASGDRVPADVRILAARNFQVEEAALTGESIPSAKSIAAVPEATPLPDRTNLAFGGTLVTAGTARALVVATGARTQLGRISQLLEATTKVQTPLTKTLTVVGKRLTILVLAISCLLLLGSSLRGYALADGVLIAIALAVAAIPEGLPAIITIALSIGVQRMAKRNAVVRRLPSVETLGSATIVCSDKTGTLTRNEMTAVALATPDETFSLSGVGLEPVGELTHAGRVEPATEAVTRLLTAGALCNDASVEAEGTSWRLTGDPTEGALVVAALKIGLRPATLQPSWPRLDVIPFESERQFMATLHASPSGPVIFVKGAPEVIISKCDLEVSAREVWLARAAELATQGMRVLAIAECARPRSATSLEDRDVVDGLRCLGLVGMIDPPRQEAVAAVAQCHQAGIVVKMITGDHLKTAEAIGRTLGLLQPGERGVTGSELAELSSDRLREVAVTTNVFARVAPEHKLQLVRALQQAGNVVAMTGDGVNDAPALKQADVGIAMGIAGTAASKEAADVVLADDNFASIASAVEEGRRIYDNLIKSLAFVLPTNLGLGLILIIAVPLFPMVSFAGEAVLLMPAEPSQLLWINLVASVALTLPLAFEVLEPDAMRRPPRAPRSPVFDRFLVLRTIGVAALMAIGAIAMFLWEYWTEVDRVGHATALREAQTEAVTTIVLFQVFYLFECRSLRSSSRRIGWFSNRAVFIGVGGLLLLHAGFVYLPFMHDIFGTAALQPEAMLWSALVAASIIPVLRVARALSTRRSAAR